MINKTQVGNASGARISHTGGGLPCELSLRIHEALQKSYYDKGERIFPFAMPENIQRVELDLISYYDTHTLLVADDCAPENYRFQELFKSEAKPLKKSDFFSVPRISTPTIKYENGKAIIQLSKACSPLYSYEITRYDYATHTTVYFGDYQEKIVDDSLSENKHYLYTVTPSYNGKVGKSVTLPIVSTKREESALQPPKEWWER